MSKEEVAAEV